MNKDINQTISLLAWLDPGQQMWFSKEQDSEGVMTKRVFIDTRRWRVGPAVKEIIVVGRVGGKSVRITASPSKWEDSAKLGMVGVTVWKVVSQSGG